MLRRILSFFFLIFKRRELGGVFWWRKGIGWLRSMEFCRWSVLVFMIFLRLGS